MGQHIQDILHCIKHLWHTWA